MRTPRRLHRSASIPDGTSTSGMSAEYAAAMMPTVAASKPISFMNSFSIGVHSMKPWRPAAV